MTAVLDRLDVEKLPHPRIRQRLTQLRRDKGRRRLRRLIAVGIVAGIAIVAFGASRSPLLDVDHLVVTGNARTSTADIMANLGVKKRTAMVDVDPDVVADRAERLPWVAHADVRREWPGRVEVRIREREAIAQFGLPGGGWMLVDAQGRMLQVLLLPVWDLVRLTGPVPGEPGDELGSQLAASLRLAGEMESELAEQIERVDERGGSLELGLRAGGKVIFGSIQEVTEKLVALERLLAAEHRSCPIFDVRVPIAPVLTEGNGCA